MQGILFKPDMIKAIVEGRKTVTRRRIDIDPLGWELSGFNEGGLLDFGVVHFWRKDYNSQGYTVKPRYQVGETVYIKETLFRHPYLNEAGYVLDETPVFINQTIGDCLKWRWTKDILSSMFMPQEAARYFIKVKDVRAERLQEITHDEALKEGCLEMSNNTTPYFHSLWDTINKPPYDWDSNPFVWVYEFTNIKEA